MIGSLFWQVSPFKHRLPSHPMELKSDCYRMVTCIFIFNPTACKDGLSSADTNLKEAQMKLKNAQSELKKKQAELKKTEKEYEKDKANLQNIEKNKSKLEVRPWK